MQHEIIKGRLLDQSGCVAEPGFAFLPVKAYDRKDVKAPKWRIKEWDYYYVGNSQHGLSLTVSDMGYIWMVGATFFDFKAPQEYSKSFVGFFSMGKFNLPSSPLEGQSHVSGKGYDFTFEVHGDERHLFGHIDDVVEGQPITFDLAMKDQNKLGLCIATPFKKKGRFYYNYKINNLLASGSVRVGEKTYDFEGAQGVLDWGRGVWTYKNTWYWLSFSGISHNKLVGANLGYGFGDTSAASENMVYEKSLVSDKPAHATKLHDVAFYIPKDDKGKDAFMGEWLIKSQSGDIDLIFKPVINRASKTNLLVIKSIQNQVFGYFTGTIISQGKPLVIDNILGFAEKVYNAW